MSPTAWARPGQYVLFGLALLAATQVREYGYEVLDQAVMWLPTGVALAGLWLLGWRAWWVVALGAVAQRTLIGYGPDVSLSAGLGSAAEALVGVALLRRLGFRPQLERLRDVLAICVAAAVAPLASIFCSWLARGVLWTSTDVAFYSGWDGWWRMNALGVLAIVPVTVSWLAAGSRRPGLRGSLRIVAVALLQAILVVAVFLVGPDGVTGVMVINITLLVALYAAVRFGPRGAVTAGSLTSVVVAVGTANGLGPFLAVDLHERHMSLQLLELFMVGMPLVFGALVAERRAAEAERRRADTELAHSRELLASINRNVNEGLYRSAPDGTIIYANVAFARLFGCETPEEILPINAFTLHANPERREELKGVIARSDYIANEEVLFRRRDGSTFWGLVSSTVVHGADGAITGYDGAITDITVWKGLEEQLRQSQRLEAVGQLAGGIAHDFNNVLTAIVGYAELIRSSVPGQGEVHGFASGVLRAAERAAALTRQLLAYSRRQVLSPQVLELGAVVEQLGEMMHRLIGENIQLRITIDPAGSWSLVDRSQLEQVVLNLVVNARDAMAEGGTITITVAPIDVDGPLAERHVWLRPGPHVALVVADNGIGMTEETRARAFDPFFTTKARSKGTGLGLSTVYGIVKQSGGGVFIDSAAGSGTTVTVYLPRVEAGAEPEPAPAPQPAATDEATILFAEDDPNVRETTVQLLARAGFTVVAGTDGLDALELAARHAGNIDLLVTDVVMPRLGGRELASRLMAERPGLRVLFISGYTDDVDDLRELAGAGGDFLQKPFGPEALVGRVRALLGRTG
ncbi:MAG: MASE1 domain-containing protein [bacterium]|nr:MASE1 domain-containing protein [bacterium]